jgi:DNA-binding transcriptional regulator LsrR (DeoR family)
MNQEKKQLIKIAKMYYDEGMTQDEIAKRLSLSRQKVNRLMKRLIPEGIVQISIDDSLDEYVELEKRLEEELGLEEAIVIQSDLDLHVLLDQLGKAGAEYLDRVIKPQTNVGIAWGRTLGYMTDHLKKPRQNFRGSIVQFAGGAPIDIDGHGAVDEINKYWKKQSGEITRVMADVLGGTPYLLHTPLFMESPEAMTILRKEPSVARVFNQMSQCDLMMVSLGGVGEHLTPFREHLLGRSQLDYLEVRGAVGNVVFRYFDIQGRSIPTPFDKHVMSPELEVMTKIPKRICVAGGAEKIEAILGGIRGEIVNVLITDFETAQAVLSLAKAE